MLDVCSVMLGFFYVDVCRRVVMCVSCRCGGATSNHRISNLPQSLCSGKSFHCWHHLLAAYKYLLVKFKYLLVVCSVMCVLCVDRWLLQPSSQGVFKPFHSHLFWESFHVDTACRSTLVTLSILVVQHLVCNLNLFQGPL
jgi:hypothetical protein